MIYTVVCALCIILSGCALQSGSTLGIDARAAIHATALAHAKETLREAQDWRALAVEAEAVTAPNK